MRGEFLDGRVTVRTQPMFWAVAALIGWSFGDGTAVGFVLGAAAVAVSVAFHESGHAAACLAFGSGADITLGGLGGWTTPRDPSRLHGWRRIVLDLAGCGAGLLLAAAAFAFLAAAALLRSPLPRTVASGAGALVEVNLLFTLFNLLPIAPMDGGRVVEHLLRPRFGVNGLRATRAFGLLVGGGAALWFLAGGNAYTAFLCGAMAAGEARMLQRSLRSTPADEDAELQARYRDAVERWERGEREAAVEAMSAVRLRAEAGLLHAAATLQLAVCLHALERDAEALELFKASRESDMTPAARRAYADAARRRGEHGLALRLARMNFHDAPGAETAAAAAVSAAALGDAREAVHWLRAAVRHGLPNAAVRGAEFDRVRQDAGFKEFVAELAERE